jgi:hypothetical protein
MARCQGSTVVRAGADAAVLQCLPHPGVFSTGQSLRDQVPRVVKEVGAELNESDRRTHSLRITKKWTTVSGCHWSDRSRTSRGSFGIANEGRTGRAPGAVAASRRSTGASARRPPRSCETTSTVRRYARLGTAKGEIEDMISRRGFRQGDSPKSMALSRQSASMRSSRRASTESSGHVRRPRLSAP